MSWTIQTDFLNGVLVCLYHTFDSIALRIENISVQSEAVVCNLIERRYRSSKS